MNTYAPPPPNSWDWKTVTFDGFWFLLAPTDTNPPTNSKTFLPTSTFMHDHDLQQESVNLPLGRTCGQTAAFNDFGYIFLTEMATNLPTN